MRGFIIDTDHLDGKRTGRLYGPLLGRPHDQSVHYTAVRDLFQAGGGFQFRLYDDDGELYYSGRCTTRDGDDAFVPLNWAMADSGCTRIDYLMPNGTWETL